MYGLSLLRVRREPACIQSHCGQTVEQEGWPMTGQWVEDLLRARDNAISGPRDKGAAPHWMRCDYFDTDGKRCLLIDGHPGDHKPPKAET